MKINFKKIFTSFIIASALAIPILNNNISALKFNLVKPLTSVSAKEETADENQNTEDQNAFNFIKSEENVKDFFYDGTILLYGGILLIVISIFGIFKTLKPKKGKVKSRKKQIPIKRNRRPQKTDISQIEIKRL